MSVRRLRTLLWLATGVALGLTVLIAVVGLASGPTARPCLPAPPTTASAGDGSSRSLPPLSSFQPLFALDLRRPLVDPPPPVAAAPVAKPPPPLALKLAGTVVEPGHSLAMLQGPDGQIEFKTVGEQAGGAEVVRIDANSVCVRYHGQLITLKQDSAP